ncbi:hypothetical protein CXG81DRAFT_9931 [Caulochytrium protostelioides]|uniref:Non-specific serine/threonine protein kinase n=1 Tax=Caulochytrium protostelioides TaxID=1555241 RepID=A0A4P9XCG3_9FUNG|nr:hypothetical protein CXG81DRAFT_9931 [Caulochytrium protostelioides]|eukprot:RKP03126.1 hypothetical protein CXG81DRAFT_9931 [Caulochytrium protostelioides]
MITQADLELYAARLSNISLKAEVKLAIVSEMRDAIEVVHSMEYGSFLTLMVPPFLQILQDAQLPTSTVPSIDEKLRNAILEVIHRFPQNDVLKPHASEILQALMVILRQDNEANAVIALKILIELHKGYKTAVEGHVEEFFEVVLTMYGNMDAAMRARFEIPAVQTDLPPTTDPQEALAQSRLFIPTGLTSFKVLTECPIILALLFRLHTPLMATNVIKFVPKIMPCLQLQPKQQREAQDAYRARTGQAMLGMAAESMDAQQRNAFAELKALQAKSISFIAYILHANNFMPLLQPYQAAIADAVVSLLLSCPAESSATRRELLVATRHVWYSDFRVAFTVHLDTLLDEDVLLGQGVTTRELLRPLAHSVLVDLIHHSRNELTPKQLWTTVQIYSRNLHDPAFAPNIQTMCAKLLLNLVESLMKHSAKTAHATAPGAPPSRTALTPAQARRMLLFILASLASKLKNINESYDAVMTAADKLVGPTGVVTAADKAKYDNRSFAAVGEIEYWTDLGFVQPICTSHRALPSSPEPVKDVKFLLKNVINGIKSLLVALRSVAPSMVPGEGDDDRLECYSDRSDCADREAKEALELFATIFIQLDAPAFQELFSTEMPFLFERIFENNAILAVPQYLLANATVSTPFAGLLLRFLVDRIEDLGGADSVKANVLLRLFKLLFMAVTLFPERNEAVLRPHLGHIIISAMNLSHHAQNALNYFSLLRALFRAIGGGRFEVLYQEVLPLLQVLLEGLNHLLTSAQKPAMRELFVELCLTIPVRLSVLLPYLNFLMKPLVVALQSSSDLVSQGLRTLELCIDNLTQDFLEPVMAPFLSELMTTLWSHLKPLPHDQVHSHTTIRILGKLGGRNRRVLNEGLKLTHKLAADSGFKTLPAMIEAAGSSHRLAADIITFVSDAPIRRADDATSPFLELEIASDASRVMHASAIAQALQVVFAALTFPDTHAEAHAMLTRVTRHVAVLVCLEHVADPPGTANALTHAITATSSMAAIRTTMDTDTDPETKLDPADLQRDPQYQALAFLRSFHAGCVALVGPRRVRGLKVFHTLVSTLCNDCYKEQSTKKAGGAVGISAVIHLMRRDRAWIQAHELAFVKALLYVLKDTSPEMAAAAAGTLLAVDSTPLAAAAATPTGTAATPPSSSSPVKPSSKSPPPPPHTAAFNCLIALLISELSNTNARVRATVQKALATLERLRGQAVSDILRPVADRLLLPIFAKPLRALPHTMQIGHIEAVTFCLDLRPSLLSFNDELIRLLHEALALADAEDHALISKNNQYKMTASLTNLRVVCIQLLSSALSCPDFKQPEPDTTRGRIISIFFKSLYSKSSQVVEVANAGLKKVLQQQQKLSKDLLQVGLRPVLVNISDPKRLTVPSLEGLARLLQLLTNYFKVEIGKKLLDHLHHWSSPQALEDASSRLLSEVEDLKIMVAILEVFPLLPTTANIFLDDLMGAVVGIERHLKRCGSSPLRPPTLKFLCRYPDDALRWFMDHYATPDMASLFLNMIEMPDAQPLRTVVTRRIEAIAERLVQADHVALFLTVLQRLLRSDPRLLAANPALWQHVVTLWGKCCAVPRNPGAGDLALASPPPASSASAAAPVKGELKAASAASPGASAAAGTIATPGTPVTTTAVMATTTMVALPNGDASHTTTSPTAAVTNAAAAGVERVIAHAKVRPNFEVIAPLLLQIILTHLGQIPRTAEIPLLFDVLGALDMKAIMDTTALRRFLLERMIYHVDLEERRAVMSVFLERFEHPGLPDHVKARDLRMLVQIYSKIWKPMQRDGHGWSSSLRVEVLQLSTCLVGHLPGMITESRGLLMRTAWKWAKPDDAEKLDDMTCKQAAYVFMATFIANIESPPKIVIQVYAALLRGHQSESRNLVRQALDILLPVMPRRVKDKESVSGLPTWVAWTRKIMIQDSHTVTQLLLLYLMIIRHTKLFWPYRDHFIAQCINSLQRLGLSPNATPDTRSLTLSMTQLIIDWEAMSDEAQREVANAASTAVASSSDRIDMALDAGASPNGRLKRRHDAMANDSSTASDAAGSAGATSSSPDPAIHSTIPVHHQENHLLYLVRFALMALADPSRKHLLNRTLHYLSQLSRRWVDASVRAAWLDRLLTAEVTDETVGTILGACEIMALLLAPRIDRAEPAVLAPFARLFERWIKADKPRVLRAVQPLLKPFFDRIKTLRPITAGGTAGSGHASTAETTPELVALVETADAVLVRSLAETTQSQTVVCLLEAMHDYRADEMTELLPDILKLFQKLADDHVELAKLTAPPPPTSSSTAPLTDKTSLDRYMMVTLLGILKDRMAPLGDQRRSLMACLGSLISHTHDRELLAFLLQLTKSWIAARRETFPTIKEKANLMVKFLVLRDRDEALTTEYLQLVADIYGNPVFARTEMTVRLEPAFLYGTSHPNPVLRHRFLSILDGSVTPKLFPRLQYIFGIQNWETLSGHYWLQQALDLLLGAMDRDAPLTTSEFLVAYLEDMRYVTTRSSEVLRPLRRLIYSDPELTRSLWIAIFPSAWALLSPHERHDLTKIMIPLLAKEYHVVAADARPNVVETLLTSIAHCHPIVQLPPQLVKYLGKTFNAWHVALEILQRSLDELYSQSEKIRESTMDAMVGLYQMLSEKDHFYGLWRRRCLFAETNCAVSFEQNGLWGQAQALYEVAQSKARTGVLPFTESEYTLWEDHWIYCTQRLQQWDILTDLAKHDGNNELLLECAWRLSDWKQERESLANAVSLLPDALRGNQFSSHSQSTKKMIYQTFLALLKIPEGPEYGAEFRRLSEEGVQLTLKQWQLLPAYVTQSHIPLLHTFQLYVELSEASQLQQTLATTLASNIDAKSQELKGILQTWRDRLPNAWDDIHLWSDLVAWRQHVFTIVNRAYLPLIPMLSHPANHPVPTPGLPGAANPTTNPATSYAYRGYHETAWIINRFAHVARKHGLSDVCISSLSRIYTLPNIEIQEAFYKLREQAKCHFRNPKEYATGLDVINNTNLLYFSTSQKAEFFMLKGVFYSKLHLHDEAQSAFSSSLHMDLTLAKSWAAWGQYNDRMFADSPKEYKYGANALNCYMQAADIYNNSRSRRFLARVLWLLNLDNDEGTIGSAFDLDRVDQSLWYWITFIPQLLLSLGHREGKHARNVLLKLARLYPQALHFQLRTTKEDLMVFKKHQQQQQQQAARREELRRSSSQLPSQAIARPTAATTMTPATSMVAGSAPATAAGTAPAAPAAAPAEPSTPKDAKPVLDPASAGGPSPSTSSIGSSAPRAAAAPAAAAPPAAKSQELKGDYVEEIMAMLKTAFPLLALSMETMVDQILQRLKSSTDEDIYRLVFALLNDGVQQLARDPSDSGSLSAATESNLLRFAETMYPGHIKYQKAFEDDFIHSKPNLSQLVDRLRHWRDRLERLLDLRPASQNLEQFSHYLVEFEYQKFDDIEVPGQYFLLCDSNRDFKKIVRFLPEITAVRGPGSCHRRLSIRGHDGRLQTFMLQNHAARHCRREERLMQLFRLLNAISDRRKDARERSLTFHLPLMVPMAPQMRLVQDDPSYVSFYEIYEQHCRQHGFPKDAPIVHYMTRMQQALAGARPARRSKVELLNLKTEILHETAQQLIPETILTQYMTARMGSWSALWLMRKQFTVQMALCAFMTYVLSIGQRFPHKFHVALATGHVWMSEVLATFSASTHLLTNNDSVPFRLTPNLQHFMGAVGIEGIFTAALMAMARALTDPETDMEDCVAIFLRDELVAWLHGARKPALSDTALRHAVQQNTALITKRCQGLACRAERDQKKMDTALPLNQTLLDLISQAANPLKLAQLEVAFLPNF